MKWNTCIHSIILHGILNLFYSGTEFTDALGLSVVQWGTRLFQMWTINVWFYSKKPWFSLLYALSYRGCQAVYWQQIRCCFGILLVLPFNQFQTFFFFGGLWEICFVYNVIKIAKWRSDGSVSFTWLHACSFSLPITNQSCLCWVFMHLWMHVHSSDAFGRCLRNLCISYVHRKESNSEA